MILFSRVLLGEKGCGCCLRRMVALLALIGLGAAMGPTVGQAQEPPVVITTPTPTPQPTSTPAPTPTRTPDAAAPRDHVVRPGDTLPQVAAALGRSLDDMHCVVAPDFVWTEPLVVGDLLQTPPPGTICHLVQPGEGLAAIAARYGVASQSIRDIPWNRLVDEPTPGTFLRILPPARVAPAAAGPLGPANDHPLYQLLQRPVSRTELPGIGGGDPGFLLPPDWPYGSGSFAWPLYGWLTQSYHPEHRAIDLSAQAGTVITAADRGEVVRAGWNNQGYGNIVILDHRIDYLTLYGHLDEILVQEGDIVARGQPIGTVGSTGNSTGPHLHFEIWDFGIPVDPLGLLGR